MSDLREAGHMEPSIGGTQRQGSPAAASVGKRHKILFLAANPLGTSAVALGQEARAIQEEFERCGYREHFQLEMRWAVQPMELLSELRKLKPTIVHFSGPGIGSARSPENGTQHNLTMDSAVHKAHSEGLWFQGDDGHAQFVSAEAIKHTFGAAGSSVKLVVLSACYSDVQAQALATHVECVVGMAGSMRDDAARYFAIGLYGGLGECESVATAFQQGVAAMRLKGIAQQSLDAQLVTKADTDAGTVYIVDASPQRSRCSIVIKATLNQFNPEVIARVRDELRRITCDCTLEITDIQEGSVKLDVSLSSEATCRLMELSERGELACILDFEVTSICVLEANAETVSSAATSPPVNHTSIAGLSAAHKKRQYLTKMDLAGMDLAGMDLAGMDLAGMDLAGMDLAGMDLRGENLEHAKLENASLTGANLSDAKLGNADLTGANLENANLENADLTGANLAGANLTGANLTGADLPGADLTGANFENANLSSADLSHANLQNADLKGAKLGRPEIPDARLIDLTGTDLTGANLIGAKLIGADLSYANLLGAKLIGANLIGANLTNAILTNANLSGALLGLPGLKPPPLAAILENVDLRLTGANLSGTTLTRADFSDADLSGANLSNAKLDNANLAGANLTDADLTDADLTGADLTRANLGCANLHRARLEKADLEHANLFGANLEGVSRDAMTVWPGAPSPKSVAVHRSKVEPD